MHRSRDHAGNHTTNAEQAAERCCQSLNRLIPNGLCLIYRPDIVDFKDVRISAKLSSAKKSQRR